MLHKILINLRGPNFTVLSKQIKIAKEPGQRHVKVRWKEFWWCNKSGREKLRKKGRRCWGMGCREGRRWIEGSVKVGEISTKGWAMRRLLKPFATRDGTRPLNQPSQFPLVLSVFSLGQRHPLSLQRFTTLRDYFKKLGGTRRASVLLSLLLYHAKATLLRNIFTLFCIHLVKGSGFLLYSFQHRVNDTLNRLFSKICGTTLNLVKALETLKRTISIIMANKSCGLRRPFLKLLWLKFDEIYD